jgi:two-component system cell cycle response regulator
VAREDDETGEIAVGIDPARESVRQRRDRPYLVVVAGPRTGEMFSVGEGVVIGRGADADVRVDDVEASRLHARITMQAGEAWVEDLESRNQTTLNGDPVTKARLTNGDKIRVGGPTVFRFGLHDMLDEAFQKQMYESALRDPLTHVYNRKYLGERLESELAYSRRHGSPVSLLLFDIDHFKKINDTYGHPAGDAVLSGLARHVLKMVRVEDVFARYGGEEFAILSRGIHLDDAHRFAERLRAAVAVCPFMFERKRIQITVSLGLGCSPRPDVTSASAFVAVVDRALYAAKESGRNRVCLAE